MYDSKLYNRPAAIYFLFISMRGLHVISDQEVGGKIIAVMQQSDHEEKGLADTSMGLKKSPNDAVAAVTAPH